jgi:hypothetical protein
MAEARSEVQWDHTSTLWALIAEVHRNRKKRTQPYEPDDIHPHAKRRRRAEKANLPKVKLKDVKGLLLGLKPKQRPTSRPKGDVD